MFEWHGWATVIASAGVEDDAASEVRQRGAVAEVNAILSSFGKEPAFETYDLRHHNGLWHVWLSGFRNHQRNAVVDLYRQIAAAAPGSYGVMYTHDDELSGQANNQWQRLIMRRGEVIVEQDSGLSPHIGLVEDQSS